jgi:hypothetical protein
MRKKRTFPIGVALGQIDHLVVLTTVVPGPILADLRREAFGQERLRTGRLQLPVAPHGTTIDLNCSAIQSITTLRRGDNCRVCE